MAKIEIMDNEVKQSTIPYQSPRRVTGKKCRTGMFVRLGDLLDNDDVEVY